MGERFATSKVAERFGVWQPTAKRWCRRGRFPNAGLAETPRGPVWTIPERVLGGFEPPRTGRPPKAQAERAEEKPKGDQASGPDGRVVVTKKGGKKR